MESDSHKNVTNNRNTRRLCCVPGCSLREGTKSVHFYRFPAKNVHQRKEWINAITKVNVDRQSIWLPKATSRICSEHFIDGKKSSIRGSPSYIPTLFPSNESSRKRQKIAGDFGDNLDENTFVDIKIEPEEILPHDFYSEEQDPFFSDDISDGAIEETDGEEDFQAMSHVEVVIKQEQLDVDEDVVEKSTSGSTPSEPQFIAPLVKLEAADDSKPLATENLGRALRPKFTFVCQFCNEDFTNRDRLNVHIKTVHHGCNWTDRVQFPCSFCSSVFKSKDLLETHIGLDHPGKDSSQTPTVKLIYRPTPEPVISKKKASVKELGLTKTNPVLPTPPKLEVKQPTKLAINRDDQAGFFCDGCGKAYRSEIFHKLFSPRCFEKETCQETHTCQLCHEIFKTKSSMSQHIIDVHHKKVTCTKCGKTFKGDLALNEHNERVHVVIEQCRVCKKFFRQENLLRDHVETEHRDLWLPPASAFQTSAQLSSLNYFCHICGQQFKQQERLADHLKLTHSSHDPAKCSLCDEVTARLGEINDKIKTITASASRSKSGGDILKNRTRASGRLWKCSRCKKIFGASQALMDHTQICGEEDQPNNTIQRTVQHSCDLCERKFPTPKEVVAHKRKVHDVEPTKSCQLCDEMFETSRELTIHVRVQHLKKKIHQCRECPRIFTSRRSLKLHVDVIHLHKGGLRCELCSKVFTTRQVLTYHIKHSKVHRRAESDSSNKESDSI